VPQLRYDRSPRQPADGGVARHLLPESCVTNSLTAGVIALRRHRQCIPLYGRRSPPPADQGPRPGSWRVATG